MRKFLALAALVVATLTVSVGSASAFCGPGFSNKAEAAAYYHSPEGSKFIPSLTHELQSAGLMPKDQTFWAFFDSSSVVVENTPKGYILTSNTSCEGYHYVPYHGRYLHSDMPVLAVRGNKSIKLIGKKKQVGKAVTRVTKVEEQKVPQPDGTTQVFKIETIQTTVTYHQKERICYTYNPFEKGYCRNFVKGPLFKICKTSTRTTKVVKGEIKKTLIRTEPAPKTPETPKETPKEKEKECQSTNSGNVSGVGAVQGCNNSPKVECSGEYSCSPITINECTSAASGGTGSNNGSGNATSLTVCEKEKEKTPPTCQELGNCEVPKCKPGETGTPPNCEVPKCKPGEIGTPPNCKVPAAPKPPKIISVTEIQEAKAHDTHPEFCVKAFVPEGTATLTVSPKWGRFEEKAELDFPSVKGEEKFCSTYEAPDDVPPGGKEKIVILIRSNQHPELFVEETEEFEIEPKPVDPS